MIAMGAFQKNLVITGKPGSGKTTLLKEALLPFKHQAAGFLTEEMRVQGVRMGFRLTTLEGETGVLASKALASPLRLNKYGIDLAVLESLGVAAVKKAIANRQIAVIDEIGSMEILSDAFRKAVLEALSGQIPVLATIRLGSQPFTDSIKQMGQTEVLVLEREDFPAVRAKVRAWLEWAIEQISCESRNANREFEENFFS